MKYWKTILIALAIVVFSFIVAILLFRPFDSMAQVLRTFLPPQGGTGSNATPTAGQILIGLTNGSYSPAYLTAGSNITIATGSGSITITGTGGSALSGGSPSALTLWASDTGVTYDSNLYYATGSDILFFLNASGTGLVLRNATATSANLSSYLNIGTTTIVSTALLNIGTSSPIITVLNNGNIGIGNIAPASK